MSNQAGIRAKSIANWVCQECGATELIQAHHEIPGNDDTIIVLCAECHSNKHQDIPKALFFRKGSQPYWNNKSAASLAKELGVHSRTIIRHAKKLEIKTGELSPWDKELIKGNIAKLNRKVKPERICFPVTCDKCGYHWLAKSPSPKRCPKQASHPKAPSKIPHHHNKRCRKPKIVMPNLKTYYYCCNRCGLTWVSLESDSLCPCGHELTMLYSNK